MIKDKMTPKASGSSSLASLSQISPPSLLCHQNSCLQLEQMKALKETKTPRDSATVAKSQDTGK